jgi:diphosphomevalonate decarboxylase
MSGKATAVAGANIAFIKYWGARDLERAIPVNPSISMTLRACHTRSTVEHLPGEHVDRITFAGPGEPLAEPDETFRRRVSRHLDALRGALETDGAFRVATRNSFPAAAGMASSASGFAALTVAVVQALGLTRSPRDLSILARLSGSGSAARSVLGGYVQWPEAPGSEDCAAAPLAPASHWDLRDVVAVVASGPKPVSSRDGHRRAATSPYFEGRQAALPARLEAAREAIRDRDLSHLGPVVEEDAVDLHIIAMSSRPPIFYWHPGTVRVLEVVRRLRDEGVAAWSTMDAGPNVHVLCGPEHEERVAARLGDLPEVTAIYRDGVGEGPTSDAEPLF